MFTLTTIFKDTTFLFCWKDLTLLVQIPHPTIGKIQILFPTPQYI